MLIVKLTKVSIYKAVYNLLYITLNLHIDGHRLYVILKERKCYYRVEDSLQQIRLLLQSAIVLS